MLKRHFCYPNLRFSSQFCQKTKSFRYDFYFVILLVSTSIVKYQKLKNFHRTVFRIFTKFMKNASSISERFTRRSGHTEQIRLIYHKSNTTYTIWPER
jgi:Txe/YoeB family toxin of Txe-Axe toxin-antitoxin module